MINFTTKILSKTNDKKVLEWNYPFLLRCIDAAHSVVSNHLFLKKSKGQDELGREIDVLYVDPLIIQHI